MYLPLNELWFGDERGYNATRQEACGGDTGCGLVMKEDITQPPIREPAALLGCGLVMKEDITQLPAMQALQRNVVVW